MGRYVLEADIELFTRGKVEYTDDVEDKNRYERTLLRAMIDEAEGEVEMDLSPRYEAPFQGKNGEAFKTLPKTTFNVIRALVRNKATIKVLESRYGRGNNVDGSKYSETLRKQYDAILDDRILLKRDGQKSGIQWAYPPLPNLKTSYFNSADDGFFGAVLSQTDSGGDTGYAAEQINDPSDTFFGLSGGDGT